MSTFDPIEIQEKLGYRFKNPQLLHQAFVAPSVTSASNNQTKNYQVLEFIGDSVLALALIKNLSKDFCYIDYNGQFVSKATLASLHKLKQKDEQNNTLEHCARVMRFNRFIEKDANFLPADSGNKRGDIIEAVLGAVAIDSDWNFEVITPVVKNILKNKNIDSDFCDKLETFCQKSNRAMPTYRFMDGTDANGAPCVQCFVSIADESEVFRAQGENQVVAKNNACKEAYKVLANDANPECQSLINPTSALNNFCQKNKIPLPTFEFKRIQKSTKVQWSCKIILKELGFEYTERAHDKRTAKMTVSAVALHYLDENIQDVLQKLHPKPKEVTAGQGLLKLVLSKYAQPQENR